MEEKEPLVIMNEIDIDSSERERRARVNIQEADSSAEDATVVGTMVVS